MRPEHRLTRSRDIEQTLREGTSVPGSGLVLYHRRVDDPGPVRFGLVVGRRVGGAVVRNRVKRRLRHVCMDVLTLVGDRADIVIVARPAVADADTGAIRAMIRDALGRLTQS